MKTAPKPNDAPRKSLVRKVWERDRGVCRVCRKDTVKLERELRPVGEAGRGGTSRQLTLLLGYKPGEKMWHADHVVARVDGGPDTLENLQTLCAACHREKTAREAGRRAKGRQSAPVRRRQGKEARRLQNRRPLRAVSPMRDAGQAKLERLAGKAVQHRQKLGSKW